MCVLLLLTNNKHWQILRRQAGSSSCKYKEYEDKKAKKFAKENRYRKNKKEIPKKKIDGKKRITIKFIKSTLHTRKKEKQAKAFSIYEENNGFDIMS